MVSTLSASVLLWFPVSGSCCGLFLGVLDRGEFWGQERVRFASLLLKPRAKLLLNFGTIKACLVFVQWVTLLRADGSLPALLFSHLFLKAAELPGVFSIIHFSWHVLPFVIMTSTAKIKGNWFLGRGWLILENVYPDTQGWLSYFRKLQLCLCPGHPPPPIKISSS